MASGASLMMDSYIGGIGSVSFVPHAMPNTSPDPDPDPNSALRLQKPKAPRQFLIDDDAGTACSKDWSDADILKQTEREETITVTYPDDSRTNINRTGEYNDGYNGLSVLPWEDFVNNPRRLNELFYVESTQRITYDPDEVNVFFHGKNVQPPTIGDVSENGKSWNILVKDINELRTVRNWMTERCSVFGVTLEFKEKRFAKPERAPCLVLMDPNAGNLGDQLYTTFTRAMDSMHNGRRFCIEINLNGCVERWCRRVLLTKCRAVGAKLVITNGEEYEALDDAENVVCCVVCFPIWLLQTGIYKLHRLAVYDDFFVRLDTEDLFLHGAFQDVHSQRQKIFQYLSSNTRNVFRTRNITMTDSDTLEELGSHKFVSVKKWKNKREDEETQPKIIEHEITTFQSIVLKRREKVLQKESRKADKTKPSEKKETIARQESECSPRKVRFDVDETEVKVPLDRQSDSDTGGKDKDGEEEVDIPQLPEIYDSADATPDPLLDAVKGSGSLFSDRQGPQSPRLQPEKEVETAENTAKDSGDTVLQAFTQDPSDQSLSEESDEADNDTGGVKPKELLIDEMLKIERTLPSITSPNQKFKAKDIDKITSEEAEKKSNKKSKKTKKNKSKSKEKPTVTRALKDLMKTTDRKEGSLPSSSDAKFLRKKNALAQSTESIKSSKKGEKETDSLVKVNADTSIVIPSQPSTVVIPVDDSITAIEPIDLNNSDSSVEEKQVVQRPKHKKDSQTKASALPVDSSSDGDEVEMLYQSQQVDRSTDVSAYKETMENSALAFNKINKTDKIAQDKDKAKPMKGSKQRGLKVNANMLDAKQAGQKAESTEDQIFKKNMNFKLKREMSMNLVTGTSVGEALSDNPHADHVISVGGAKKIINTTDPYQSQLETDIEVLDWEADGVVAANPSPPNLTQHAPQTGSQRPRGDSSAKRRSRGKHYDSTRKYLGTALPKQRKDQTVVTKR